MSRDAKHKTVQGMIDGSVGAKETVDHCWEITWGSFSGPYIFSVIHVSIADRTVPSATDTRHACNDSGLLLDRSGYESDD